MITAGREGRHRGTDEAEMSKFRRRENESDRGGARRTSTDRFYFDDCVRRFEKLSALLGGRERGSGDAGEEEGERRGLYVEIERFVDWLVQSVGRESM